MKAHVVALAGIAVIGAVGCGSKTAAGPVDSGISADQACADVAKARCTEISKCSSIVLSIRYADEATCEAREKANCASALAAPSTGNSPAASEACASALGENVDCIGYLDNSPPTACQTKAGALANGAPCAFPAQYQTGYCAVGTGSVCGTCAPQPAAGDSCTTTFCNQGLVCGAISKTCDVPVGQGAACDTAACHAGFACAGAAGARTCQPFASVAAAGQACGFVSGARVACAAGGLCKFPAGQSSGTCLAAAADGAACDDTNGPMCAQPARCVSATCQLPSAANCH